jgi:N-acetylmuramoyl-L-alanine amidase
MSVNFRTVRIWQFDFKFRDDSRFPKPKVSWKPSPNFSPRGVVSIDTIILHHTASNSGAADLAHLRDPNSKVSAHYLVHQDGKVDQLVKDRDAAWHAGGGEDKKKTRGSGVGMNGRSIGIEIVNDGLGSTPFTDAQYRALIPLVGHLKEKYGISDERILGHKEVTPEKIDPAPNFSWKRLRDGIR